jgi:Fe-S cluster assembly protein SufD
MIAVSPEIEQYRRAFDRARPESAEPAWLRDLRGQAMERFEVLGFPTTRHEEWKYTSVQPIVEMEFSNGAGVSATVADVERAIGDAAIRLVFVNGHYAADLSRTDGLPPGVTVSNLAAAIEHAPHQAERHLGQYARFVQQHFVALNTALFRDGAFIHIPRGKVVETPIHLLFLALPTNSPVAAHVRSLFVVDENAQATIVETYAGRIGINFTNVVTEIVVDKHANLDHYKAQLEGEFAFHIAAQQLEQAGSSVFSSHNISFGGALVRNDINGRLGGEHIESTINGLYVVNGRQHVDNHTAIDHAMPNCNSHELYKGIMDDRATGVFNGKIFVRQDAQKTDAKQTNQNLLLSANAVVDTKPQLEIFADDVRCTHGATVGQLNADALFYLRSRGIGLADARAMLVYAFARDVLDRIKVEPLRERLEEILLRKLGN